MRLFGVYFDKSAGQIMVQAARSGWEWWTKPRPWFLELRWGTK
jgi:hypothetical protein